MMITSNIYIYISYIYHIYIYHILVFVGAYLKNFVPDHA